MPLSDLPVLYSFRRCPYAMRARLALASSGQRCVLREVHLANKPDALQKASAKATVPVLVLPDGSVIDESLDIMLWALRGHDPQGWLPESPSELRASLQLIARCDGEFKRHLDHYKYPQRAGLNDGLQGRAQGAGFLLELNTQLTERSHLAGETSGLADMALLPFVRQYAHTDQDWFANQHWRALSAWLAAFEASGAFAQAMQKYPVWESTQFVSYFPAMP